VFDAQGNGDVADRDNSHDNKGESKRKAITLYREVTAGITYRK
jgi:hypothetical protein